MVIRENFKCTICNKIYTFRTSVGHQRENYFTVRCSDCGQPLTIKLNVDQENVRAWIEPVENIANSEDGGQFVNIHPDLLIPTDQLHSEDYSVLDHMRLIGESCESFINRYCPGKFKDFYKSFSYGRDLPDDYLKRKTIYDLVQSGRDDLALERQKDIKRICTQIFSEYYEINNLIDLAIGLLQPKPFDRFWNLKKFYRKVSKKYNIKSAAKFIRSRDKEHLDKFILALKTFFDGYHEFSKVSLYVRAGIPIPDATTSASTCFDEIKKIYGDGFEIIMDLAITPAIFNNLYMGRNYDQFEKMDLDKYITIDKAGKMNCFNNNPSIVYLADHINSQIRNASHHNNISMDFNLGRDQIIYKSGRPAKEYKIDYAKYLELTVKLYFDIFALYAAERNYIHR